MKKRMAIWLVTFVAAAFCCRLAFFSLQPVQSGRTEIQNIPERTLAGSPLPITTGILSNTNFQLALRALQQRSQVQQLPEPERTTRRDWGAVNRMYYGMTFTLPVTNNER